MRRCAICNQKLPADSKFGPFCSKRCREIDLGRWLDEQYTVPVEGERVLKQAIEEVERTESEN